MTAGIYRIDGPNSKIYIGSSVNIEKRFLYHKEDLRKGMHHSPHLQHAWNKHGEGAFTFTIVEAIEDKTRLLYYEQIWLDVLFNSLDGDEIYNICTVAGNTLGFKHSKETIEKLRNASKGNTNRRGSKLSDETKKKLSRARKSKPTTLGKHCSEETKMKISEAQIKRYQNPGVREHLSKIKTGKKLGPRNK